MKIASYDWFDLDVRRMVAFGVGASAAAVAVSGLALGDVLGTAKPPVLLIVGFVVMYGVMSTPRRLLDRQRAAQARESVLLSAAATACLSVTGSRSRTMIVLRSRQPSLAGALAKIGKQTLLGNRVEASIAQASRGIPSFSAANVFAGLAHPRSAAYDAGDEEVRGLDLSAEQSRETKLPVFMTACFFTPMMLLLYSVFSREYTAQALAELFAFEFMVLDLVFYFTAGDRGPA